MYKAAGILTLLYVLQHKRRNLTDSNSHHFLFPEKKIKYFYTTTCQVK